MKAMVESPRIATVKHVALATAADALLPILSAISFPRGITDPYYRQTKDSTPSRVALRSGAKVVVAGKTPIHPSRTDQSVVSAGSSWLSVRAGLLPIVVEETCEVADLAVMFADRECHWERQ
ncbi:hypothetical protein BDV34DRAFT_223063 [Aspergillus parasiticus]|uniref:Uncharacterized protein n=1 Tax=Aspergillus parasiticus TaxID=5067 RepID=A0A5N6DTG9_ASPPA|nr:hypothetical protein BDV34DRAFT_223063 [Aspergillus parasiticus]